MYHRHVPRPMRYLGPARHSLFLCTTIVLCSALFENARVLAEPALPNIDVVIESVRAAEHAILNLQIQHFDFALESLPPNATDWQKSKYMESGTAWYNGLRRSKARINISRQVIEWEDGKALWLEIQQDIGYDGQFGRIVKYRSGALGTPRSDNTGQLLPDAPTELRDRYQAFADGTGFSLNFYRSLKDENLPLSDELAALVKKGAIFDISWDTLYGDRLIRLLVGDIAQTHFAYWLDPIHGYAIRRVEEVGQRPNHTPSVRRMEVLELGAAGPNIWFPVKATREEPFAGKVGTQMKMLFHAEKVIANDPAFDEQIFTIAFPKNYWVTDKIHGGAFLTVDPKKTAERIDGDLAVLREQHSVDNSSPPVVTGQPSGVVGESAPISKPGHRTTVIILMSIVVCVACAAVLWIAGKRIRGSASGRQISILLCIGLLLLVHSGPVAAQMRDMPEAPSAVKLNCGVNVAYVGLKWFNRPCDLERVGRDLDAGAFFERDCSLVDIKKLWLSHNLEVQGLHGDDLKEILDAIPSSAICVLRLAKDFRGTDVGHFVVLIPAASGVDIVDPPLASIHMTREQAIADSTLKAATGEFLVAMERSNILASGPALYAPVFTIDLGRIPIGTNDFVGLFHYENRGARQLKILNAHRSCSCMEPPEGDFVLEAGSSGTVRVKFARDKVTPGPNVRRLLLETNDPQHQKVLVTFQFDLVVTPRTYELGVAPQSIDYGRSTANEIVGQTSELELTVPIDAKGGASPLIHIETSTPLLKVEGIHGNNEQGQDAGGVLTRPVVSTAALQQTPATTTVLVTPQLARSVWKYRVHWEQAPSPGLVDAEIRITVTSKLGKSQLRIPVRAECIGS